MSGCIAKEMRWLPTFSDVKFALIALSVFGVVIVPFGLSTGLLELSPMRDLAEIGQVAIIAFFIPALFEEALFRGPLAFMSDIGSRKLLPVVALSLSLFVLWHPFNAYVFLSDARELFFDWRFLFVAAFLGIVATWLAVKSRSLWPAILFHWLAVVGWKIFFGGPRFF